MTINKNLQNFFKFFLPLMLWLFLFRSFILGRTLIMNENFMFYSILKNYLDNLRLGLIPLWDPFSSWGVYHVICLTHISPFNPLWLVTLVLDFIGMTYYQAYVCSLVIYFFVGLWGFYLLAQRVLKNSQASYAAFVLLTFSSLSFPIVSQLIPLFIFVPSVWFFYFLLGFLETWEKKFFLGAVLSGIIIGSTYLPFYFFTVFLFVVLCCMAVYPRRIWVTTLGLGRFFKKNFFLVILCGILVALSLWPAINSYQNARDQQIVSPERHDGKKSALQEGVVLPHYFSGGALSARMAFEDLYAHLDHIQYGNDGFFYVPLFAFILLVLGGVNKNDRRSIILALVTTLIFLLTMANAAFLHPLLFKYIFYFRLFRNLHYMVPFLLGSFILFVCYQFKLFIESLNPEAKTPLLTLMLVIIVHLMLIIFFLIREYVIVSSYITVGLSLVYWGYSLLFRSPKKPLWIGAVLFLCLVVQPMEVFWSYTSQGGQYTPNESIEQNVTAGPARPRFVYTRKESFWKGDQEDFNILFQVFRLNMQDDPGFMVPTKAFPAYWSYFLARKVPEEVFRPYVRNKFYLYDRIHLTNQEKDGVNEVIAAFRTQANMAYVHLKTEAIPRELEVLGSVDPQKISENPRIIKGDSGFFKVRDFSPNRIVIETNYEDEKFLVYTDSFHRDWQGTINDKKVPIYRSNIAFKGVRLPGGKNVLVLQFRPLGGVWIYFLTYACTMALCLYLILVFYFFRKSFITKQVD